MSSGFTNIKNGINLQPKSADPSSPQSGDIYFSDGTARAVGLWQYYSGAWNLFSAVGLTTVSKTTTGTLSLGEDIVLVDTTSGDVTLTLPTAVGNEGVIFRIVKVTGSGILYLEGDGTETIQNQLVFGIYLNSQTVTLVSNGTQWSALADERRVHFHRTSNNGQSVGTAAVIDFEDVGTGSLADAFTYSAGTVTIKERGTYLISAAVKLVSATYAAGDVVRIRIEINTVVTHDFLYTLEAESVADTTTPPMLISATRPLVDGDTVRIAVVSAKSATVNTTTERNFLHITRVGN